MAARLTSYLVVGIVAATLIAGLIVRAQRDDNEGPVDLIVHNAVVFTGNPSQKTAEAVAVRANQILQVGSNREIVRLQRPQTVMIDAKGGAVVPGFNDAHLHLVEGGLSLDGIDLSEAATIDDAIERVRIWAADNPDKPWVTGTGWTFEPGIAPTRQALDAVVADRPVYLVSDDRSAAWVNTRALKLSKIARRTPDPEHGRIQRDRRGEPTGILEGSAVQRVAALLPGPSEADRMRAIINALTEAQRLGITSIQTTAADLTELEMLDAVKLDGTIGMRLYPVLTVAAGSSESDVEKLDPVLVRYSEDPLMKAGAATVSLDGVDDDRVNRLVRLLDGRGWQVSLEADTDDEAARANYAFDHARRSNNAVIRERRHRLEHRDGVFTQIGKAKAIGSDWPRGPLSPMRVLQTALTYHAMKDALRAYTYGGAFASFDEKRKGTLEPGMLADIVVLTANIFKLEPAELDNVRVAYTIFDGRVVYPAERKTTTTFP
jgi:predicted amidohydrolase YtcJ